MFSNPTGKAIPLIPEIVVGTVILGDLIIGGMLELGRRALNGLIYLTSDITIPCKT